MPITEAKPSDLEWFKKNQQDFSQNKKEFIRPTKRRVSLNRCPGIFGIMGSGWVQRAWQDISIETNGDGENFSWATPADQKEMGLGSSGVRDYVSAHMDLQQLYSNDFRNLRSIVKIQSPWSVRIPEGYTLLAIPMPYPDHSDYEAAFGTFKGGPAPHQLSVQLRWYVKDAVCLIPAGTPLQQYILVKDEKVDTVVRASEEKDEVDLNTAIMALHNSFASKYANFKKVFHNKVK